MEIDLSDIEWNTSKTVEAIRELRDVVSDLNSKIDKIELKTSSQDSGISAEYLWELKEANRHLREIAIDKPSMLSVIAYIGVWSIIFKLVSHFFG